MANRRRSIPSISGGFDGLAQTERGEFASDEAVEALLRRLREWNFDFPRGRLLIFAKYSIIWILSTRELQRAYDSQSVGLSISSRVFRRIGVAQTRGIRKYVVPQFPYLIYYSVAQQQREIRIHTIRHAARRPFLSP